MLEFLISGIGALASYNAQKRAAKAQEAAFQRQLEQDRKNRELAKEDAANKFVDMSNAAEKAGINRLTALRATGGAGFGMYGGYTAQAPILSRASFFETFGGSMLKTWATNKINEPIDKYNKAVRTLDIQQRIHDIAISSKTLENMSKPQKQDRAMQVPILDPHTGKPILDDEEQPMFMHALNQEVQPMYIAIRNPITGQVFGYPNPEIADMGPTEFATFMALTTLFEKHAEDGTDFTWKGIGLPGRIRFDDGLRFPNANNATQSRLPTRSAGWPQ